MSVFSRPEFDDHEHVSFFSDPSVGLRAIIAIHRSSALGIAGGGCRMWPYASDDAALRDALRLSQAMTYKVVLAGLPAGGAKCVVIGDSRTDKSEELLRALGRAVHRLGGRYVMAEDVGTTPDDMECIAKETPYVTGRLRDTGDTGPATAEGVYLALRLATQHKLGRDSVEGLHVAVQGLGGVGGRLAEKLARAGAQLTVTDIRPDACERARQQFGAAVVAPDAIAAVEADVFSPNALGDALTAETIASLRCKVVAGAANNQLADAGCADLLAERNILYVPDFVANMGGVIGASDARNFPENVATRLQRIPEVLAEVLSVAETEGISTHQAAVNLATAALDERKRTEKPRKWVRSLWSRPWIARSILWARSTLTSSQRLGPE